MILSFSSKKASDCGFQVGFSSEEYWAHIPLIHSQRENTFFEIPEEKECGNFSMVSLVIT